MHVKEKSNSQILRSHAFPWKNDVTNGIFWCAWSHNEIQWLPQGIRRVSRLWVMWAVGRKKLWQQPWKLRIWLVQSIFKKDQSTKPKHEELRNTTNSPQMKTTVADTMYVTYHHFSNFNQVKTKSHSSYIVSTPINLMSPYLSALTQVNMSSLNCLLLAEQYLNARWQQWKMNGRQTNPFQLQYSCRDCCPLYWFDADPWIGSDEINECADR